MSSIGSIAGAGLSQLFQNLATGASNSAAQGAGQTSTATSAKGHHHHGGGGFAKLADAITSALQSTGTSTDPNQTITQALAKIFKNGSLGSPAAADDDTEESTPTTAQGTPANPGTAAPGANLPAEFLQTLKSFGVTPQQFQTDVTNALQSAQQNGTADLSSIFKSFPVGSLVDAVG